MKRRRPLAMGLSVAAVALIVFGAIVLVYDSGSNGGGGFGSPSIVASGSPRPTSGASRSQAVSPSGASPAPTAGLASASPFPSSNSSAGASPSSTPNPAAFVKTSNGLIWRGSDGTIVPVPDVAGLTVSIQSGRAIYYTSTPNRYGLRAGLYAGEFMPMVTMGRDDGSSAQTGGLALTGPVVTRLINDAIAAATSDADRWIVALPVDIRQAAGSNVSVQFDRYGLSGWQNTPRVVIRFTGTLPVTEAVPLNFGFHVLVEELGVARWQIIDPIRLTLPTDAIDPAHAMNELLVYGSGAPSLSRDLLFDSRVVMGSVLVRVAGDVSVSLVVPGSRADLGPDKVLVVGNVPVFVASS